MNAAPVISHLLTPLQLGLIELTEGGILRVQLRGPEKTAGRALEDKGLGTVTQDGRGALWFSINDAGRDQLRVRR